MSHININKIRCIMLQFCLLCILINRTIYAQYLPQTNREAATLVPFVIPAQVSPGSLLAQKYEPITTQSRLKTQPDGHFYDQNGKRIRLLGVNLSFNANFPTHADAVKIAKRLALAGINAVRCHHMDTSRWPRGIWDKTGTRLEPQALDRLDYFIDQLARRGIYTDLNLHVGRSHSRYLHLPNPTTQYDKMVDIFTPQLINAQKDYARKLLNHVNKYRHLRYADDPAIALVEISNEDSLFMWSATRTLPNLPPFYANILQRQFNQWLKTRYHSTRQLRHIWCKSTCPLGSNILVNPNFHNPRHLKTSKNYRTNKSQPKYFPWQLEQHKQCRAKLSLTNYRNMSALQITPTKIDNINWHLQFNQAHLALKANQVYTVQFTIAADTARPLTAGVSQAHSPWANMGFNRKITLTPQWKTYRFNFTARKSDNNARLSFSLGANRATIYLANVQLIPGVEYQLAKNSSLETGTIHLFGSSAGNTESPGRITDRLSFLADTERKFFSGMRDFIKDELHYKGLVTGTIVFGPLGLYGQSDMDFIDGHAYWQHPRFPGRPWDSRNWFVRQQPMVDNINKSPLFNLIADRMAGKPFTVTEYNHPAPLDSQASCMPFISSVAATQDWDGIWIYTYSQSNDNWHSGYFRSYFDICNNPAKWGFIPAAATIFRHNGLAPLANSKIWLLSNTGNSSLLTGLARLYVKYSRFMVPILYATCSLTPHDIAHIRAMASP